MRCFRIATIALVALGVTGCSSLISSWKTRPVAAHKLYSGRMFSLTGERRLAFFVPRADAGRPYSAAEDEYRTAWCAESLPEASQAVAATSKPSFGQGELKLGTEDSLTTTLTQTFTRTEVAEVFRQLGWQTCQAWAQGVLSDDQYRAHLGDLVKTGLEVIKIRASQPVSALPTTGKESGSSSADSATPAGKGETKKTGKE